MTTSRNEKAKFRPVNTSNVIIGLVFLVGALFFIFYMVPNYIQEAPLVKNPMMSPKWLPNIAGWMTAFFSLLLVAEGMFGKQDDRNKVKDAGPVWRWILMVAAFSIYFFFFELAGAIVSGVMATAILFMAHPIRQWSVYVLALAFPLVVVFLFIKLLDVPLPVHFFF